MRDFPAPQADRLGADLEKLATFVDDSVPGWTRRVFSEIDVEARHWVRDQMDEAGLEVRQDAAGNLIGTLAGGGPGGRPAVVTGSHTDTVQSGGRFDGIVGVLGAIEVVRLLRESGVRLDHDLRVVNFLGEEPNDFGLSCVGSRAVAANLTTEHLGFTDPSGRTMADAFTAVGGDPDGALRCGWPSQEVAAFVELHIEQGPTLEREGVPLAVVSAIAGIDRLSAVFQGRADHAGTAPMDWRHDAACAAAEGVLALEQIGRDGGVATAGRIELRPGALNVVPERAKLWAELRNPEGGWLAEARPRVEQAFAAAGQARGVEVEVEWLSDEHPTPMHDTVRQQIAAAAERLGHRFLTLPSWAGHDAAQMARLAPTGMVFVPSAGGRSHCPEEYTDLPDIAVGVQALGQVLLHLDQPDG